MTPRQRNWEEIGIAFDRQPSKRTKKQHLLTLDGLCESADRMNIPYNRIHLFVWDVDQDDRYGDYFSQPRFDADETTRNNAWTRQCDFERAFFAYLMAAISDNDYKEMVR